MSYWWASQGKNYEIAIPQQTLWSCPQPNGVEPKNRVLLKQMALGDTVFHYARGYLRAVSEVTRTWTDHARPEGYPRRPGESDDGWLVRVKPLESNLSVPFQRLGQLIKHGAPGPLDKNGEPQQKYVSPIDDDDAYALLVELGLPAESAAVHASFFGMPGFVWGSEPTDALALRAVRKEQGELRAHLLAGRAHASCSICGETYPAKLLIAGHIKPRHLCSDEERRDFSASAMLVCALGCDVLFEWGYITVDTDGSVTDGKPPETSALRRSVSSLVGNQCTSFSVETAPRFRAHRERSLELI